jgi:plasmid stabilization system protein ParE
VARRLVLTRAAEGDLAEQVDYVGTDRPAVARRYILAVYSTFDRLLGMPELGARRSYPVRGYENVRIWPMPGFRSRDSDEFGSTMLQARWYVADRRVSL